MDPQGYPLPSRMKREECLSAVEEALDRLPRQFKGYLENVVICVEDLPDDVQAFGLEGPQVVELRPDRRHRVASQGDVSGYRHIHFVRGVRLSRPERVRLPSDAGAPQKTKARVWPQAFRSSFRQIRRSADIRYERQDRQRGDLNVLVQQQHAHSRPTSCMDVRLSYLV